MSLNRGKDINYHSEILLELNKHKELKNKIVGIDFSGDVRRGSFEDFEEIIDKYRRSINCNITIHSPEVELFVHENKRIINKTQQTRGRIGHFIHYNKNDALQVIDKKIPIEFCPTSNYVLMNISNINDLHINKLLKLGLTEFCINTDDVLLFDSSLSEEWTVFSKISGWTVDQIKDQIKKSVKYAFCDNTTKKWILEQLN